MHRVFVLVFAMLAPAAFAADVDVTSRFSSTQTLERFVKALKESGVDILSQETRTNRDLGNPEMVVVFQNPFYGTSIGACHKGARKDLPLQARIWTDGAGHVHLEYEQPDPIVNRYGVIECGNETEKLRVQLSTFAYAATE